MYTQLLHFHTLLFAGVCFTSTSYLTCSLSRFLCLSRTPKVSRPSVVQLNWKGFSHKAGAWGRDSAPNSNSSLYWVAPLDINFR